MPATSSARGSVPESRDPAANAQRGVAPTVGIIGGGQLGLMLARKAGQLGLATVVLDPDPGCPAAAVATRTVVGALDDARSLRALVSQADITTFEIEHIAAAPLLELEGEGAVIRPSPRVLALIQDKLAQKQFLVDHGLPTSRFVAMDSPSVDVLRDFGGPCVQKLRTGGYDGRGVAVFAAREGMPGEGDLLPGPSLLEAFVDCAMEIAVVVARRPGGEVSSFPVVEMAFDDNNVLDVLVAPARLEPALAAQARALAEATVTALDGVGVFGVEMFVDHDQQLFINEVAPRVHNSGHFTIEACRTSQFEQHLRAIVDWPLGDVAQHSPAVMVNLLSASGSATGPAQLHGLAETLSLGGVSLHWYGKATSRPGRKMGHLTVTDASAEVAAERARAAKAALIVDGRAVQEAAS